MSINAPTVAGIAFGVGLAVYIALNLVRPFAATVETLPLGANVETVFASDIESTQSAVIPTVSAPPVPIMAAMPMIKAAPAKPSPPEVVVAQAQTAPAPAPAPAPPKPVAAVPAPARPAPAPAPAVAKPKPAAVAAPPVKPAVPARRDVAVNSKEPKAPSAPPPVAAQAATTKPDPARKTAPQPNADAPIQWWPKKPTAGRLNLLYAGQAANTHSIALLFDSTLAATSASGGNVKVLDTSGTSKPGTWVLNGNRRMLLFSNLPSGRYIVILSSTLTGSSGLKLGVEMKGPVTIR